MNDQINMYYDIHGQPMSAHDYNAAMKAGNIIALKKLWFGTVSIKTVWEGMSVSYQPDQKPVLFQTHVYVNGELYDQEGYSNIDDALAGHNHWVRVYRNPYTTILAMVPIVE